MNTLNMFSTLSEHCKSVGIEKGEYIHKYNFYDKITTDKYLKRLIKDIKWKQESLNMSGKNIPFPRLTS
jgi:hypothetical protein